MRGHLVRKNCELTLDFGPFSHQRELPPGSLFQRVKSQMLKRKEKTVLRKKPIEYEKLQVSLQEKLKKKSFNREEQNDQIVMLQKCKNYFQLRRHHEPFLTPRSHKPTHSTRPQSSCLATPSKEGFITQLQDVMRECGNRQTEIKEDLQLFAYYCKAMDRRLQGIKNNIQRKERMV